VDELGRWAAERAPELLARAEAEAVAELKAALLRAATAAAAPAPVTAPAEPAPAATVPAEPAPAAGGVGEPPPAADPPAAPVGDALWAYCVAGDDAALAAGKVDAVGVHPGSELEWVRENGLAVLCSSVPLAEFGEEPLRRNLNDMPWLERTARAHEAVIAAAFERSAVVPLRLCTLFAGAEGARRMLAEQHDELAGALDALSGREEWSVKLIVDPDALAAGLREPGEEPTEPGTGAAYLLLRREERRLREAVADRAAGLAEDIHARLQERAVDARVRPAQNRELAGYEGEMVLNGAYLVERDQADGLRALVAELEERHRPVGARIELGGPFPPYSFVPESE
jgi:Gas vesicle synthesis protein GvpL/GvpF